MKRDEHAHTRSPKAHACKRCTQLLVLQLLLDNRHAGRQLLKDPKDPSSASKRGNHAVSHQTAKAPHTMRTRREHWPGVLTRESYTLAIHIVKTHKPFTKCPVRSTATRTIQRQACCWAQQEVDSAAEEQAGSTQHTANQQLRGTLWLEIALERRNTQAHSGTLSKGHRHYYKRDEVLGCLPSDRNRLRAC